MNVLRATPKDFVFGLSIVILGAAVVLINIYAPGYTANM